MRREYYTDQLCAGVHLHSDHHSATPDDQCDYYEVEYADYGSSIH